MPINDTNIEHRPMSELLNIVRNDFKQYDVEGLIDEGTLVKTVMYCNEKLGLTIREVREVAIPVIEFRANLPLDFEKLYYVCGLQATNTMVSTQINPFDNNVDQDIIYEAKLDRDTLGCVDNYQVTVNRLTNTTIHQYGTWTQLDVTGPEKFCHIDCPNKKKKGKYTISIHEDHLETPFRAGTLYLMYIGMMKDIEGNITFPFHPMITPFYEWSLKEKILSDAIFNSDAANIAEKYKLAQQERLKAWIEAYNFSTEKGYGEYAKAQRKKELGWYHTWFRYFQ